MKIIKKENKILISHDGKVMTPEMFQKWMWIKKIIDTYRLKNTEYEIIYSDGEIAEIKEVKVVEGIGQLKLKDWMKDLGWATKIKITQK